MSKHTLGLVVGAFLALLHTVWSLAVLITPEGVQAYIDWILRLHHISLSMSIITPFSFVNAALLIIFTFVVGYIVGYVLAALFNKLHQ